MRKKTNAGFSLIEIMITISIVAILASVATPMYIKYTYRARGVEGTVNLGGIRTAMVSFKSSFDTYLNVTIEPSTPVIGAKKPWGNFAAVDNAAQFGVGTFSNLGFVPAGQVYFHYGCTFLGEAARCEAATDLDADGRQKIYSLAWRTETSALDPPGAFSGANPVIAWGEIFDLTPGRF